MPNAGDKKTVYKYKTWIICPNCEKGRWVETSNIQTQGTKFTSLCFPCHNLIIKKPFFQSLSQETKNKNRPKYKMSSKSRGYILVRLKKDDFFYPMIDKCGYVREHRLVMAKHLGRCLHAWEIVHHKHTKYPAGSIEDKQDNRIENLQLATDDRHNGITVLENKIKRLENILNQNDIRY